MWVRSIKVALLLSALVAPTTRADEGASRAEAAAHYQHGLELANQGKYQPALDEFEAAYAASPNFVVLYNVGQAQMALRRPIEAIAALTRYLQEGADQVPLDRRELVQAQIALLEAKLAELTITTAQPGVTIRVDDREIGQTPLLQPLRLAAGIHAVTAAPPRGAPVTREVTLAEGERQKLALVFPAPPRATPAAAREASASAPAPALIAKPESRSPIVTLRRAAIVTVTTGLLLGGAALGAYVWNRGRYNDWQNGNAALQNVQKNTTEYQKEAIANNQLADSLARANDAILILSVAAGALVATSAVLYWVDRAHRGRASELAVAWARDSAGEPTAIVGWSVPW